MATHLRQVHVKQTRMRDEDSIPPSWVTSASLGTYNSGSSISVTLVAVRSSGAAVTQFRVASGSSLPAGIVLDTTTGVLTGTLPTVSLGVTQNYSFAIEAVSGGGATSRTFTLSVTLNPPVWTTASGMIVDGVAGDTVLVQLGASDPDNNITGYSLVSGTLPSGVGLNTNSGTLSGILPTLSTTTTYVFTLRVTDAYGNFNDRDFSIRIKVYGTEIVWVTSEGTLADTGLAAPVRAALAAVSRQVLI